MVNARQRASLIILAWWLLRPVVFPCCAAKEGQEEGKKGEEDPCMPLLGGRLQLDGSLQAQP